MFNPINHKSGFLVLVSLVSLAIECSAQPNRPATPVDVVNSSVPVTVQNPSVPVTIQNTALPVSVNNPTTSVTVNNGTSSPIPVRNVDSQSRIPYQQSILFNQTGDTCPNQFYCVAKFDMVPNGSRLVITYVGARFGLASGGTAANAELVTNGDIFGSNQLILPAPVRIGFDTYVVAGPVTFYVDAGDTPAVTFGGQYVDTVSHTAQVTISGYMVSVP